MLVIKMPGKGREKSEFNEDWRVATLQHIFLSSSLSSSLSFYLLPYYFLRDCSCHLGSQWVDGGLMTADDDVHQTPKQTGTVRTGMMVP